MLVCPECGFQNAPGTTFCTNPTSPNHPGPCGAFLDWAGFEREQEQGGAAAPLTGRPESAPAAGRVAVVAVISPTEVEVEPGREATIGVRVRNLGSVVDKFVLALEGPPAEWSMVEPATLALFPDTEGMAAVMLRPPRSWQVPAGPARFRLRVSSSAQPGTFTMVDGVVVVGAFSSLDGRVVPQTSRGTGGAEHRVMVENSGNESVSLTFAASDPDEVLQLGINPTFVTVDPGATATVVVQVRATRALGGPVAQPRQFTVEVTTHGGEQLPLTATFVQEPIATPAPAAAPRPAPAAPPPQPWAERPPKRRSCLGTLVKLFLVLVLLLVAAAVAAYLAGVRIASDGSVIWPT
ncbi:MAG: hypothetical protein QOD63_291 [Actinomycetota bacterium]|jgi:hypothetical protein|nr:hypothetical protein [Actinomycetota bacterium]